MIEKRKLGTSNLEVSDIEFTADELQDINSASSDMAPMMMVAR